MEGLGGQQEQAKLTTIQVPLPEDVDGILDVVRTIILKGEIQNISITNGEPITYQRRLNPGEEISPSESTQGFAELTPQEVTRNIPMEEFDDMEYDLEGVNVYVKLVWMFILLENRGLAVTHLIVSEDTDFWTWLGVQKQLGVGISKFLGARIEHDSDLPPTVFLLCAAKHKSATIAEIEYILKGNAVKAEVQNERVNEKSDCSGTCGCEHTKVDAVVEDAGTGGGGGEAGGAEGDNAGDALTLSK